MPPSRNTARSPAAWARCSTGSGSPATPSRAPARSPTPCWTAYDTGGRTAGITAYRKALARRRCRTTRHPRPADLGRDARRRGTRRVLGAGRPPRGRHHRRRIHPRAAAAGGSPPAAIARGYLTVAQAGTRRGQLPGPDPRRTPRPVGRLPRPGPGRAHPGCAAAAHRSDHRCPATPRTTSPRSAGSCSAFAGDGAALTVNNTLGRALLTEACHRFDWLILGKQAPPENQLPEAHRLRAHPRPNSARPAAAAAGSGSPPAGQDLLHADTPTLWDAVTGTLIPTDPARGRSRRDHPDAAAHRPTPGYGSPVVADILTGEGWRTERRRPAHPPRHRLDDRRSPRPARLPAPHRKPPPATTHR